MRDLELQVLKSVVDWTDQGLDTWLCTVVETYGSSPRPPGSMMVYASDGRRRGSLSGGCVEDHLIERLTTPEFSVRSSMVLYGDDDSVRWGLPCGGIMRVHVLHLSIDDLANYRWVVDSLEQRKRVHRVVNFYAGSEHYELIPVRRDIQVSEQAFEYTLGPSVRLLLIGANPVSAYVAQIAQMMGFYVVVCDPDLDRLKNWDGPAVTFSSEMPDDAVRLWANDRDSVVLGLSHDPKLDDMALMEALKGPAFYVGAMGSLKTSRTRRQRLSQLDLTEKEISRLIAPVGLDIGSKTPAEIAISIMADIVLHSSRGESEWT